MTEAEIEPGQCPAMTADVVADCRQAIEDAICGRDYEYSRRTLDAFTAILDEHGDPYEEGRFIYCSVCSGPFPCPTVLSVAGALGVGQEAP